MNLKRAFKALWKDEPISDTGIPESEQLEEPVSEENIEPKRAQFIAFQPVSPAQEIIEQSQ